MIVVLSLGGSIVNPEKPNTEYLKKLAKIIKKSKHKFGIVCGGGFPARQYANAAKKLGANEFEADEIAIRSTKQNAHLVKIALGDLAYPEVIDAFEKAPACLEKHKVVVMGGTIPGITTDTDAMLLAEKLHAKRFLNLSNVDGIYDKDPKKGNAKKYKRITKQELLKMAEKNDERKAGQNFVFDIVACKLLNRTDIEVHFVKGTDLKQVELAINGKKHNGTVVK